MRQIVLDTETTGLAVDQGHRIIEIGCIELNNRRATGNNFWRYVNPDREIDAGAVAVHGITNAFLADKPMFHVLGQELWDYLKGAELIIHNAAFDVGFLDKEFARCGMEASLASVCTITDTVSMARRLHPGQKANLDALCKRYFIDNSNRKFHGALLDAQLLAEVYLAMTGGQSRLLLDSAASGGQRRENRLMPQLLEKSAGQAATIIMANPEETERHEARITQIKKKSGKDFWH
jgi:DNA polymerase-3 subunit epsilon